MMGCRGAYARWEVQLTQAGIAITFSEELDWTRVYRCLR